MSFEANTVRESLVRGSEAISASQFSMSVCDNTPDDDNVVTSTAEVESEVIGLRMFESVYDDG